MRVKGRYPLKYYQIIYSLLADGLKGIEKEKRCFPLRKGAGKGYLEVGTSVNRL